MDKAKQILEEALSYKNCDGLIDEGSRLEDAVLYALNEALRQPLVSKSLPADKIYDIIKEQNFGKCIRTAKDCDCEGDYCHAIMVLAEKLAGNVC
jgi:hypothetical protein